MNKKIALTVGLLLVAAAFTAAAADGPQWRTTLNGFQEVPVVSTDGNGIFNARLDGDELTFELRYADLEGAVMAAHIHFGRARTNGGVLAWLCGGGGQDACPPAPATVTGTVDADDVVGPESQGVSPGDFEELIRAMKSGVTYINVHTDAFGGGEIRGQVGRGLSDSAPRSRSTPRGR